MKTSNSNPNRVIAHIRKTHEDYNPLNLKGYELTIVGLINSNEISFGVSKCSPRDNFNRKKGIGIATERAKNNPDLIKKLDEPDSIKAGLRVLYNFVDTLKNNPEFIFSRGYIPQ